MKLNVSLEQLWTNVKRMEAKEAFIDLGDVWKDSDIEFDDQLSTFGIDINLNELESEEGLLSVRGRQVLLFIPDHSFRIEKVISSPKIGNKFHVADCQKLDEMKRKNSFERYKVTNNISGEFDIYGTSEVGQLLEAKTPLRVCKLCLNKLNYKGSANMAAIDRDILVEEFSLEEFFTTFSSLFQKLPKQYANVGNKGYTDDWSDISLKVRKEAQFICQHCNVDLSSDKKLLHTHHINGDKADNSPNNLIALCADCHRKEPFHGHMFVKHEDTQRINQLRNIQGIYANCDWPSVTRKVDPSLLGIVEHCKVKGYTAPEVAYQLYSNDTSKQALLELAWPKRKFGVVLNKAVQIDDWRILTLSEALEFFGKRKKVPRN